MAEIPILLDEQGNPILTESGLTIFLEPVPEGWAVASVQTGVWTVKAQQTEDWTER